MTPTGRMSFSERPMKSSQVEVRPIPGFSGYAARSDGAIISYWQRQKRQSGAGAEWRIGSREKVMRGLPDKRDGRLMYNLRADCGKSFRKCGGTLVLIAFVGTKPTGMQCCHWDGDCTNDAVENLRWGTAISNRDDMLRHGTRLQGDRHPMSKITVKQVLEIRSRSGESRRALSEEFGLGQSTIYKIISRKLWAHVT